MAFFDDIQKIAFLSVLRPDYDAWIRKVCRWYSRTFKTPLDQVEDLPINYVLQHYWETVFDEMEDAEKRQALMELLETPEDRKKRVEQEQRAEEDFVAAAQAEVDKEKIKNKQTLKKAIKGLEKLAMKPPEPPPEEVEVKFVDEAVLEALIEAGDKTKK